MTEPITPATIPQVLHTRHAVVRVRSFLTDQPDLLALGDYDLGRFLIAEVVDSLKRGSHSLVERSDGVEWQAPVFERQLGLGKLIAILKPSEGRGQPGSLSVVTVVSRTALRTPPPARGQPAHPKADEKVMVLWHTTEHGEEFQAFDFVPYGQLRVRLAQLVGAGIPEEKVTVWRQLKASLNLSVKETA